MPESSSAAPGGAEENPSSRTQYHWSWSGSDYGEMKLTGWFNISVNPKRCYHTWLICEDTGLEFFKQHPMHLYCSEFPLRNPFALLFPATLRIIGPSYKGFWICIAGLWDLQKALVSMILRHISARQWLWPQNWWILGSFEAQLLQSSNHGVCCARTLRSRWCHQLSWFPLASTSKRVITVYNRWMMLRICLITKSKSSQDASWTLHQFLSWSWQLFHSLLSIWKMMVIDGKLLKNKHIRTIVQNSEQ